jgi:hypothetical protein
METRSSLKAQYFLQQLSPKSEAGRNGSLMTGVQLLDVGRRNFISLHDI